LLSNLIPRANFARFTNPDSKLPCRVGVDFGLVYERDQMLLEYMKLDKRIKSLINAALYFTRCQKINKCKYRQNNQYYFEACRLITSSYTNIQLLILSACRFGTISAYSYILMVLSFLMSGLDNPTIPCVQNLRSDCKSPGCFYYAYYQALCSMVKLKKIQSDIITV
jgi:hypothetical protein